MSVDAKHPLYTEFADDWTQMRDTYRGERIVKEAGFRYLPATSGMVADGITTANAPGLIAYNAYKKRAHFPDIVREAVEAAIGVMHQKPPVIELPAALEPLRERATLANESLEVLLRRINTEQLVTGRLGLLVDFPVNTRMLAQDANSTSDVVSKGVAPREVPYIAVYTSETIINWDAGFRDGLGVDSLNFVSLDESEYERQEDFSWLQVKKYRVLILGQPDVNEPEGGADTYSVGVFRDQALTFDATKLITPMYRGQTIDFIPFTIINSKDVVPEPDDAPLLGLASLVLSIYRQDADYKQTLFMQGQDTLVTIGANDDGEQLRAGAGARISVPQGGDAKYIGVSSTGLAEQRQSLENDRARAANKGGQLLDSVSKERESGQALTIRVAARTASLKQIALAGAFGLQQALQDAARWVGADPEQVIVTPNLDFVSETFDADQLLKLVSAKNAGAPISLETIHAIMREKDFTEFDFEEELDKIEEEETLGMGATDPADLPDDEDPDEEDPDEEDDSEEDPPAE